MAGRWRGRRLAWLVAGGFFLAAAVAAGVHFVPRLIYMQWGHLALKPVKGGLDAARLRVINRTTGGLKARVVWSSSRSGNHEIYLLKLPSGRLFRLTNHPHVDFFPRFSPDGRFIVFARSQKKWVSERREDPWDTYLLELSTGKERLLARNANYPQWVDQGRVSFQRGTQVVVKDLAGGSEQVIYDAARPPVRGRLGTPELSRSRPGLLAITTRGRISGNLVVDLKSGRHTFYGPGCEITFLPPGQGVIWVDTRGRQKTRFVFSPLGKPRPRLLWDSAGDYSHEYFPRASRDGRWLVWGASTGGHEHDIADYEIFLRSLGRPAAQAVRLTYNGGNDRWPDIYLD